jgi:FixJ family two-component response regulator
MAARAIEAGAAGFLLKPFEDQQLLEAVGGAIGRGP